MWRIEADVPSAAEATQRLLEVCEQHGCHLDHSMRVHIEAGDLMIHSDAGIDTPLVSVPSELFVPLDMIRYDHLTRTFDVAESEATSDAQVEIASAIVELYNATDKVSAVLNEHPAHALADPGAVAAISRLRSFERRSDADAGKTFLTTRVYKHDKGAVLLPVVDLFNHDRRGSSLSLSDGTMSIRAWRRPGATSTSECFVSYGARRDAVVLAVVYGFVDTTVPYAHSIPLELEHRDLGNIVIRQAGLHFGHHDLPRVEIGDDVVHLGGLLFHSGRPGRLRMSLELIVDGVATRRGRSDADVPALVTWLIGAVARANIAALDDAERALEAVGDGAAAMVLTAVRCQRDVVQQTCAALDVDPFDAS